MTSTYEILADRASLPCDLLDAHGVAIISKEQGFKIEYQPFRHPVLLDKEIRIQVDESGICVSDTNWMKYPWGQPLYPIALGHEIIGTVTHVGEKVTSFQVGDRVGHGILRDFCETCEDCCFGYNNLCTSKSLTIGLHYGGWATSFQGNSKCFSKIPESILKYNSPLMCAGVSVYSPLRRDLSPGMKVGIVGIGGLGHLGIQYARSMGCEVTAISTSPDKESESKMFGAHYFLNSNDPEQLRKAARSLNYVLDTSSAGSIKSYLKLLRPNGVVGLTSFSQNQEPLNLFDLVNYNIAIRGSIIGSMEDLKSMLDFTSLHGINCKSEVYKFTEALIGIESSAFSKPKGPRYRGVIETGSFLETFTPSN